MQLLRGPGSKELASGAAHCEEKKAPCAWLIWLYLLPSCRKTLIWQDAPWRRIFLIHVKVPVDGLWAGASALRLAVEGSRGVRLSGTLRHRGVARLLCFPGSEGSGTN